MNTNVASSSAAVKPERAVRMLNPEGLYDPRSNGYSHVAIAPASGQWIFVAGQGGENVQGELSPVFKTQLLQSLANVCTALAASGAQWRDVAKLTILVVDHNAERLQDISAAVQALSLTELAPACSLIPVPRLALDGMLIEIEALACLPAAAPAR